MTTFVGKELKYNENEVWHKGNFNPDAVKTLLFQNTQTIKLDFETNRVPIGLKFKKALSFDKWQIMCLLALAKEYQYVDNALLVTKNDEIIEPGIEYKVSADKHWIEKIDGNWAVGDVFDYMVFKSEVY
ncbi:hypothetical protein [Ruminiclostridium cellobioparum]|uniref:Uncharacterized protein n=1 Tax=Ruminiclostridium cellobioparum subsp. termitidis CT1112 TaxID=1195236 RepID=S0FJ90_RUMCE|nr:hypothetical protein [Ruminiclostridium cellobioparum]EMS72175.1 hypothetical protein CTER_1915 [Ruminiclostridium cellobioparum subsp. termitidis CT1112]